MKIIDIADRIDKSKKNETHIDITDFNYELKYDFDYINEDKMTRLKAYWIGSWYCTDSYVGYRMYFLDEEPVAISTQIGRKWDEEFKWFSKELVLRVREYLISLMPSEELDFALCDINEDIGDGYKISFNSQILNRDMATLNGEPIKILERIKDTSDYGIDASLKVQLPSGEETIIEISDIEFRYHLN